MSTTTRHLLPDGYTLVRLSAGDLDEIAALAAAVVAECWAAHPAHQAHGSDRDRLARIAAERDLLGVRRADGTLAAFGSVCVIDGVAQLGTLYVADRRQGLARALLHARCELARDAGATSARAYVTDWNAASEANLSAAGFSLTAAEPDGWDPTGAGRLHTWTMRL